MNDIMLSIENVSKQYKLGQIGGTTLKEELQRFSAKLRKKEDPTKKIGEMDYEYGSTFMALNDVSFAINKGERVGIIGKNGAGKSTLLKLVSRVTAPTNGRICLNGRVASMLEVGTGFHPELTGRENIYMNGAILGMSRREIDSKMEDIIEFSECRKFIDTPVKRYSSGMYVKLAFSVAAHLDSEIMIMDEVLAVGDMSFQKKCLEKMSNVSKEQGRTILYVSHNMSTIRQLCDRCIVLNKGTVIFDGDVEQAIKIYVGDSTADMGVNIDLSGSRMKHLPKQVMGKIEKVRLIDKEFAKYKLFEEIVFDLEIRGYRTIDSPCVRVEVRGEDDTPVGAGYIHDLKQIDKDSMAVKRISIKELRLIPGKYKVLLVLYEVDQFGNYNDIDAVFPAFTFEVVDLDEKLRIIWNSKMWGRTILSLE